jgi:3'-5' exoribonuclease
MMPETSLHPEKGPFLREIKPDDQFTGFYVLRSKQLEPFRDPSRGYFLTLILSDRSGQLLARVWEGAEETYEAVPQGEVVKVQGEAEEYLGRTQIRVVQVRAANPDEFELGDMLPSSKRDSEEMLAELQTYIEQFENKHLRALIVSLFGDENFRSQFAQAPAAKRVHHAYLGGVLEHTLELLAVANRVVDVFPDMDADLLLAGVMLHDIGKVREYSWDFDIDYSDEGRLLGHIVIGDEIVSAAIQSIPDFPPELALRMRHMLLAHHGRYEWGSPRRPLTLEAIALHLIENLGAQINRFQSLLEKRSPEEVWTEYDRLLGRQLYAGQDDDLNVEERGLTE